jgi:hypothetical protein
VVGLNAWLNQKPTIQVSFIKAHTNKNDAISCGNANADKVAKLGVELKANTIITLDTHRVYLSLNGKYFYRVSRKT